MTDETPNAEGEPSPATPEATPTAETTPTAPAAEQPTQAVPTAAAPAAPTVAAAAPAPERPPGIFIPKWLGLVVAAIVAALVFGGIGYAIGDSSSDAGPQSASNTVPSNGNQFPNGNGFPGGGQFPNGNRFPNDNGNGNGNGNGDAREANTGFLGVGVETTQDEQGVEVTDVASDSPAADAGIQEGDVVTAIDGTSVTSAEALRDAIQAKDSGDEISITYTRDGSSNTVQVTLASRSEAQSS